MRLFQIPLVLVGLLVLIFFSPPSTEVCRELMANLHSLLNLFSRVTCAQCSGKRGQQKAHRGVFSKVFSLLEKTRRKQEAGESLPVVHLIPAMALSPLTTQTGTMALFKSRSLY